MEDDLLSLCRVPEDLDAQIGEVASTPKGIDAPLATELNYAAAIKRATSALVGYRSLPLQSYSILQNAHAKEALDPPPAVGSGRVAASAASTAALVPRGTFAGLQPKRGLAMLPPHIQAAGNYGELLENATAVDTVVAMKAINYQINTEYLHHAEKVEGLHHLVQTRILFSDRWAPHWDTYERMDQNDRSRLEHAARKLNTEFLRHQRAANSLNDRLGQLLQSRDKVALDTIEKHYLERILADNAASSSMMQWAEHQSKVLKQSELAPMRSTTGSAPAFASLREYRKRAGKSRWGLAPLS